MRTGKSTLLGAACLAIAFLGCMPADNEPDPIRLDDGQGGQASTGGMMEPSPSGGSDEPDPGPADFDCVDVEVTASIPTAVESDGGSTGDDVGPAACVASTRGSADFVALFRAPYAGDFTISTVGSSFDTVLHVRVGGCTGRTVACNDDFMAMASQATVSLAAQEAAVIVVDGFNGMSGAVRLEISGKEDACADGEDNDGDGDADCEDTDCFLMCEDPADWPAEWADKEDEMLVYTNEARAAGARCAQDQFGPAPPMTMNEFARYAARLHSRDMAMQNYFEHASLDGRMFDQRMRAVGFDGGQPWGENLAGGQAEAADAVEGLMNSPGHCRNIMNPDFRVVGMGYAFERGSSLKHYWTQNFGGSD